MEDVFFSSSAKHYQDGKRNVIPGNVNKIILLFISLCCALEINAQIKVQREYDYVGTETNSAGLRKVGNRTEIYDEGYYNNKRKTMLYGCIDNDGNEIVPLKYESLELGKYPYIIVELPSTYSSLALKGLLTEDGKRFMANLLYKDIIPDPVSFNNFKCAIFKTHKDHYGIVNKQAVEIVPPVYDDISWIDEKNGYLKAKLNGKWGIIDYKGNTTLSCQYHNIYGYNGYAIVVDDNANNYERMLVKASGEIVIPMGKYDDLSNFNGWVLWANEGNKWALLNNKGETVLPFKDYGKWEVFGNNGVVGLIKYKSRGSNEHRYFDDLGHEYKTHKAAETANERIRKNRIVITNHLPVLTWLNAEDKVQQQEYNLQVSVQSDSKIEETAIFVNGSQDRGIKTVNSSDYDLTINRTLMLNEGANVIKVSVRNAAGTTQEEKTVVYRPQRGELPAIEWLDFAATASKKEYQMRLGIKSKSKVEEVNVTVNGSLTRGIKTVEADGYDLTVDRTLALSEGINRIVVSVRNGDGISTSEKVITYQGNNPIPVFNDKRIAFVVGNSHYSNSEMNLANPENDAKDVAEKLKSLGFEVVLKLDATLEMMDKELSAFGGKARDYDVALFYYAGHGIQSKGVNYIIPTNIDNLAEDNMKYRCVDMERVLDVMEDSKCKLKIVILDACRNDPLSRRWHRSAGTRGLSIMNAPTGTIISFSTSPGSTALDGTGRNSPYTQAFLNTLDLPNLDVFHFFQKVGASVLEVTKKEQNPWLSVSFTGDFYFNKQ